MNDNTPRLIVDRISDGNKSNFSISVQESCRSYDRLLHYTNVNTLEYILCNDKTLRFSSLTNVLLNDQDEKERQDIKQFAQGFFVSCFCHCQEEKDYFWNNYGGTDNQAKILLKFQNFSDCFSQYIHTDYLITGENKKMSFGAEGMVKDTGQYLTFNMFGQTFTGKLSVPSNDLDIDIRNWLQFIDFIDVEYVPKDDKRITENYKSLTDLSYQDTQVAHNLSTYKITPLAKYKTVEEWGIEEETRIVCKLYICDKVPFDYLLIRLKDEIFANLEIVTNPWANDGKLEQRIRDLISISPINEKIKKTICISKSQ